MIISISRLADVTASRVVETPGRVVVMTADAELVTGPLNLPVRADGGAVRLGLTLVEALEVRRAARDLRAYLKRKRPG